MSMYPLTNKWNNNFNSNLLFVSATPPPLRVSQKNKTGVLLNISNQKEANYSKPCSYYNSCPYLSFKYNNFSEWFMKAKILNIEKYPKMFILVSPLRKLSLTWHPSPNRKENCKQERIQDWNSRKGLTSTKIQQEEEKGKKTMTHAKRWDNSKKLEISRLKEFYEFFNRKLSK